MIDGRKKIGNGFRHGAFFIFSMMIAALTVLGADISSANAATAANTTQTASGLSTEFADEQPHAGRVHVLVELKTSPAAHVYAAQQQISAADIGQVTAATQAHLATIRHEQQAASAQLAHIGADELYRLQRVYNGIAVVVDAAQIDAILSLPNVAAVHPMTPKIPDHQRSVPFVGAPAIWGGLTSFPADGEGITIAVIDTGVDYLHANFDGSRGYADNDPTQIGDVPDFPGAKVIAGYDFAGDVYNADSASSTYDPFPTPDPDPFDCHGHGTHVAGTAAGQGVYHNPSIAAYPGPFDADTFGSTFEIGPGVAPAAKIVALKVFGCIGSSDLTELAIEWAVDPNSDGDFSDRVDVINMSLGSLYGTAYDPTAIASDNAALIGIVVVASAGNSGDVYYVTGAPATARRAISVAAANDHLISSIQAADGSADNAASTFTSRGPRRADHGLKPDIATPGESILSARAGAPGTGRTSMSGTSMAAPHVAGAMALLRQTYPDWRVEELKALVMNTSRLQGRVAAKPYGPTRIGSGMLDLPNALNTEVIAYSGDDPGEVGLSFGAPAVIDRSVGVKNLRIHNKGDQDADFTLTYMSTADTPGVEIWAERESVTVPARGFASLPVMMTAAADEMRHTRPPTVSETQSQPRHWLSEESGHLLLWPSDGILAAVLTPDGAPSEKPGVGPTATYTYTPKSGILNYVLMLQEIDPTLVDTIEMRYGLRGEDDGLAYRLPIPDDRIDVTVPITGAVVLKSQDEPLLASGALHLRVTMTGTGVAEIRGQIEAQPAVLHVPVYAAPRPSSDMRAAQSNLKVSAGDRAPQSLSLIGYDLAADAPPMDYVSLVSAFELQYSSRNAPPTGRNDAKIDLTDHADLRYVGIASDLHSIPNGEIAESTIHFGIAVYADWSTPREVEFDIYIDADEDGRDDFRLFNSDAMAYLPRHAASDAFVAVVENLQTGKFSDTRMLNGLSPLSVDTALFNTNVMILPVAAADIGLSSANLDFNYQIESWSNESTGPVEITPVRRYDLSAGVIDILSLAGSAPIFDDLDGGHIDFRFSLRNYLAAGDRDLLLFHHQNGPGNRVEVVDVQLEWPFEHYLPMISVQ